MIGKFYSRHVFPRILDLFLDRPRIEQYRKAALAEVRGKTMEIGFGTGLNLCCYPNDINRIVAVEPNSGMERLAKKRIANSGVEVEPIHWQADVLPVNDGEFDSVVSTWTMCSIADITTAMAEIRRTLRDGGRFYFLEHGLSDNPTLQKWQTRLTPVNKVISGGCHLDRDIIKIIRAAGFRIIKSDKINPADAPAILGTIYYGIAEKE